MKKVFMASAIAAMMMAAVSCGCNSQQQELENAVNELIEALDAAADSTCCAADSTCTECAEEISQEVVETPAE